MLYASKSVIPVTDTFPVNIKCATIPTIIIPIKLKSVIGEILMVSNFPKNKPKNPTIAPAKGPYAILHKTVPEKTNSIPRVHLIYTWYHIENAPIKIKNIMKNNALM